MSGITPILDTLLHQVLGKRVEIPPPRDLNQPVQPLSPDHALEALGREARSDPGAARLNQAVGTRVAPTPEQAPAAPAPDASSQSGSTRTHFSVAARAIADILARFPAPPATLRPATPLLMEGQAPAAEMLAGRLQASIEHSGLFYESHLGRWFRGELSQQQLAREPQMAHARPASAPGVAAEPATTVANDGKAPAAPAGAPASSERTHSIADTDNRTSVQTLREPVHEALHGLLRHQLEMLATPVLRWEGDVWSGLFMALLIQMPAQHQPGSGADGSEPEQEGEEAQVWRSELRLRTVGLGEIQVRLSLVGDRLALDLSAASLASAERLRDGGEALQQRLRAAGFESVRLRVLTAGETPDHG